MIPAPMSNLSEALLATGFINLLCNRQVCSVTLSIAVVELFLDTICMGCHMESCTAILEKVYPGLDGVSVFPPHAFRMESMRLMTAARSNFETIIGEHSGKRRP